jgi:GTP pyrophosphokinase
MLEYFNVNSNLDLYYRVGIKTVDNKKIKDFAKYYNNRFLKFFNERLRSKPKIKKIKKEFISNNDKIVFGRDKKEFSYKLSECCNPISGDRIFGLSTLNNGILVHKHDCNFSISLQSNFAYRIIPAYWIDSNKQEFTVELQMSGIDQKGLVNKVTRIISNHMNIDIKKMNFYTEEELFKGNILIRVNNQDHIKKLTQKLLTISGIEKIARK